MKQGYKVWQDILPHISKSHRQTIGVKIELISESNMRNDLAKFFLTIAWECKIIDDKKFIRISEVLVEVGKMIFRWKEYLEKKNPSEKIFGENA